MLALTFKTLSIRNFLSFGNVESVFELNDQGAVEVVGENLDKGGSNGSGKTTIIQAICYALYNKAFDNISLQRLINQTNASKSTLMEVRLTFSKGDVEYEVYRARGEEYRIEVWRDGENITPGKGVTETDALIQEIIGISYEVFVKTIIFSGNSPPFLDLAVHPQRMILEELFGITELSTKAKKLKELIKALESDIKVSEAVVKQQEVAVELYQKHVREAKTRIDKWDITNRKSIAELELLMEKRKNSTVDLVEQHALRTEWNRITGTVRPQYEKKLNPLQYKFEQLETKAAKLLKEQAHLADAKCPYCSQDFAGSAAKLEAITAEIETTTVSIEDYLTQITELESEIELQVTKPLAELKEKIVLNDKEYLELVQADKEAARSEENLARLRADENPHHEAHNNLLAEGPPEIDTTKIDTLHRKLDHMQFLLKLLTDKNSFIRRRIINKSIPFLNARLNLHTKSLGLPHLVKFDADMSCTVSEFGRELDFGNLSAGEKKRVSSALAMAFLDVFQHLHAKVNLLIVDELEGGLDMPGMEAMVHALRSRSREMSVFVISHHIAVQGRLDKELRIRKENGFSCVVSD